MATNPGTSEQMLEYDRNTRRADKHPNSKRDWITYNTIDQDYKSGYLAIQQLNLHRDWGIYDEYWRSHQNPPENEDDPASVTNVIHPVIESQVADLVDTPVDFLIKGVEPSDQAWAKYAQFICKWIWEQNKMTTKLDRFERIRLKYGTAIFKVYYDPLGNKGRGKICIDILSPEKLIIDPKITDPMKIDEADFMIQVGDVSLRWLVRRFGKRAKHVRPRSGSIYKNNIFAGEDLKDAQGITNNSATLLEWWSRDEEGKLRLVYMADDVILWDSTWPRKYQQEMNLGYEWDETESFYQHGKYPFIVVPCYLRDGQVWGMGDVELLKPVQDMINDFDDQIRMNARLMGNIQTVVGLASGINPLKWTNKPGLRIPARDPMAWKMVEPPSIPPYIMDRRELGKREAELISGRTDVVEGRKPAGIKAASAIIALQEAGNRRVNHKKLMTQNALCDVITMAFAYFTEFFDEEMAIRVAGPRPDAPDQFAWIRGTDFNTIPKMTPDYEATPNADGVVPLKQLKERVYNKDGTLKEEIPQDKEAEFDFYVSVGAGLPRNKSFLYQAAIELHREQILTTEEARFFFKEMIDWPLIDPFNPVGAYSQMRPEMMDMMGQGQPGMPMQPTGAPGMGQTPQGMNPQLIQALSTLLGGAG